MLLLLTLIACDDPSGACIDGTDEVVICREEFRSVCNSHPEGLFVAESTCADEGFDIPASDCNGPDSGGWFDDAGCETLLAEG